MFSPAQRIYLNFLRMKKGKEELVNGIRKMHPAFTDTIPIYHLYVCMVKDQDAKADPTYVSDSKPNTDPLPLLFFFVVAEFSKCFVEVFCVTMKAILLHNFNSSNMLL